jgi:putative spermidine/putrescine transport system substrate-binding protein/spermidine/putrescine transport system substrate-binding protein
VRKYWATAGELVDLYAGGEVWISNTWGGYQSALLAEQGIEVTEFIPEEGAEGWMDSWMIVKGSPNQECAYKFLNMQISEQGQCGVANVNGYSVANPVAAKACMSEEQFSALHQDDPDYLDSLLMWQPLGERLEAYTNAWNAVKAQ